MTSTTRWTTFALVLMLTGSALAANFPGFGDLPERPALPDPLVMLNGDPVTTAEDWTTKRRPELKALFEHYIYGVTAPEDSIVVSETASPQTILDGAAVLKQVTLAFSGLPGADAPRIRLALFLPAKASGPVPVFLGLNKCGNYTVHSDPAILHHSETWCHGACPKTVEEGRGAQEAFWCIPYLISRGYAFATFHESDVDPDKNDMTDGVHGAYPPTAAAAHQWGTIAAWSWGLRRCVDYLVTDPSIDAEKVAVIGHSRRGKAALLTGAFDERVALVVPHQSGTGGMALSRNNDEESIERINTSCPNWFCDAFTWFHNNESRLPVDQHLMAALVAPRALFETVGLQDTWANYISSLKGIQAAAPVYALLGAPGMKGDGMLVGPTQVDVATVGNLVQYRLDTEHTLNQAYWQGILDFSDSYFDR